MSADDELQGSARAFAAGKVDAVLELDLVVMCAERPHFFVRRHQHYTMPVGQARRFHRGMEMEANGELVARAAQARLALGVQENVLTVEPHAVGRQDQNALVENAEARG